MFNPQKMKSPRQQSMLVLSSKLTVCKKKSVLQQISTIKSKCLWRIYDTDCCQAHLSSPRLGAGICLLGSGGNSFLEELRDE